MLSKYDSSHGAVKLRLYLHAMFTALGFIVLFSLAAIGLSIRGPSGFSNRPRSISCCSVSTSNGLVIIKPMLLLLSLTSTLGLAEAVQDLSLVGPSNS